MKNLSAPLRAVLDFFFPHYCLVCQTDARAGQSPLCPDCLAALPRAPGGVCPRCAAPTDKGAECAQCRKTSPPFVRCLAPCLYAGPARTAVLGLKNGRHPSLARPMAGLMADYLRRFSPDWDAVDLIVPVARNRLVFALKGENHAAALAGELGRLLDRPVAEHLLRRALRLKPQKALDRAAREKNLLGAFRLREKDRASVRGKYVLLVDDVLTTGATACACTRVLLAAGAGRVGVLVFARTAPPEGKKTT